MWVIFTHSYARRAKIRDRLWFIKYLYTIKYKFSEEKEICELIKYWEKNDISVFNNFLKEPGTCYEVFMDSIENLPYIVYEDKRMYFPYNYKFPIEEGKKVLGDLWLEQQSGSPHKYIDHNIKVCKGDIIADCGVCEGNFTIKYIEDISKAYLFECDKRWIKPLEKTFEKFRDKIVMCNKPLGQYDGRNSIKLDTIIQGECNFIKMDIEGAEVPALLGGRDLLQRNDVKCAICAYHQSGAEMAIRDVLRAYQYDTYTSNGYMVFLYDDDIWTTLELRRGIVYGQKEDTR